MLHPDWLGGMCITCWWAWSVRCILLRSAGSCLDRQEVVERDRRWKINKRRWWGCSTGRHTHTQTHKHTRLFHLPESQYGLAVLHMLHSKIINMRRLEPKTLQTAVNYDPRPEVEMISELVGWFYLRSVLKLENGRVWPSYGEGMACFLFCRWPTNYKLCVHTE